MAQTATITSKRQLTIPAEMFRQLAWKEGEKVIVKHDGDELRIISALSLVDKLAGSVKVPKQYRNVPIDEAIERAKLDYFKKRALR